MERKPAGGYRMAKKQQRTILSMVAMMQQDIDQEGATRRLLELAKADRKAYLDAAGVWL